MKYDTSKTFERIFHSVALDYEPISKAPSSVPTPDGLRGKELEKWQDDFLLKEAQKQYKCLDYTTGNIKLMRNPLIMGSRREKPVLLMSFEDAKSKAAMGDTGSSGGGIF